MQRTTNDLLVQLGRMDGNQARLVILLITLALFVLGAGAPMAGGGAGG